MFAVADAFSPEPPIVPTAAQPSARETSTSGPDEGVSPTTESQTGWFCCLVAPIKISCILAKVSEV